MEAALLGVVLDSSVLIAAERKLTPAEAIESVQRNVGDAPVVLCALAIAEIAHGIYRANTEEMRSRRRAFLEEVKVTVPIHPVTVATAEIKASTCLWLTSSSAPLPWNSGMRSP